MSLSLMCLTPTTLVTLLAETCLVIELRAVLLRPSGLSMIVIVSYVEYNQLLVLKFYRVRVFLRMGGTIQSTSDIQYN